MYAQSMQRSRLARETAGSALLCRACHALACNSRPWPAADAGCTWVCSAGPPAAWHAQMRMAPSLEPVAKRWLLGAQLQAHTMRWWALAMRCTSLKGDLLHARCWSSAAAGSTAAVHVCGQALEPTLFAHRRSVVHLKQAGLLMRYAPASTLQVGCRPWTLFASSLDAYPEHMLPSPGSAEPAQAQA